MLSKNKGITLIALVITIIVLLILAGVSLSIILKEDGIVTKAQGATRTHEKNKIIEDIQLEIMEKKIDSASGNMELSDEEVEDILKKYGTVNKDENGAIKSLTPTGEPYAILIEEIYVTEVEADTEE